MTKSVYLQASDPKNNVWVSASAGSGKTKTLTDRFLRLMLHGVSPEKILCVTFTKVAASEMLNRIQSTLARWYSISDEELQMEISYIDQNSSSKDLSRARSLFAEFIENQERVQIQTLHSFCQKLINTFPLEAGLKTNTEVISEHQRAAFIEQTKNSFLENYESELQNTSFLDYLLGNIHESTLEELLEKAAYISNISTLPDKESYLQKCFDALGSTPEKSQKDTDKSLSLLTDKISSNFDILSSCTEALSHLIIPCLNFKKHLNIESLRNIFLTTTGSPRKTIVKKKEQKDFPEIYELLLEIRDLVYEHSQNEIMQHTIHCSAGFIDLLFLFNEYFTELKQAQGYIDYDDIIKVSIKLLENEALSSWIDSKLNIKIEHVMVDESQDVNLNQWKIINSCIKDFFSSGENTIFVVGDQKQSIYSFQGSSPELFCGMKNMLQNKAKNFDKEIHSVDFQKSFRSDKLILAFVDSVFSKIDKVNIDYFCENNLTHTAHKEFPNASVELWPLVTNIKEKNNSNDWQIATEYQNTYIPSKTLSHLIAEKIKALISSKQFIPSDFMILVRKRDEFTNHIVSALKERDIPVSGMDRTILRDHIAVKDLLSLMQFLVTPEDDYNLACLLKSPLFNTDEEELLALCKRGNRSLWDNLDKKPEAQEYLQSLLDATEIHHPYKLISHCLDIQGKRRDFLSRLGMHANETLNEFLDICLEFENSTTSSLVSFIHWFSNTKLEVKKEFDNSKNEVKVMTIHASKGLQAKYVILPDTTTAPKNKERILFDQLNDISIYNVPENQNQSYQEISKNIKMRTLQEYYRLLYVALTRAKTHLLICGHSNSETISDLSWYNIIHETVRDTYTKEKCKDLYGYTKSDKKLEDQKFFISNSDYIYKEEHGEANKEAFEKSSDAEITLPDFLFKNFENQDNNISISPSERVTIPDVQTRRALEIGRLVHKALEYFVPLKRKISEQEVAEFCSTFYKDTSPSKLVKNICILANEYILPIVSDHELMTELKISKKYDMGKERYHMFGTMDLVVFSGDKIFLIDYKTDKKVPENQNSIPEKYIRQMSLYKDMLQSTYKDKKILCYLAWTHEPKLTYLENIKTPDLKNLALT